MHGGGFASYAQARSDRISRLDELRRRWDEEHEKLKALVRMYRHKASYNDAMASRLQAAETRLRKFEQAGPPELAPREQNIRIRLRGARTGKRAVICEDLELTGLMNPFSLEVWFGERVAVLGSNGSGKSALLRLLAGEPVPHSGQWRLGARISAGLFAQTHERPDLAERTPAEVLMTEHALLRNEAMAALARYELQFCASQPFGTLSGGQQARLQILLLELAGSTLLLLDEPTDNLDLASAEACRRPGILRGRGARGHPRPVVRPLVRPVRGVRLGRRRVRGGRSGLGRDPHGTATVRRRLARLARHLSRPGSAGHQLEGFGQ